MKSDWQQQLKQALNNHSLAAAKQFSKEASELFPAVLTGDMHARIDWDQEHDPVLAQFLPQAAETIESSDYHKDPVGDHAATQVPGLIHKYHGRVLLIASGSCAVNCRYCFRRHFPYSQSFAPRRHWQQSIEYIKQNNSIHEVILSGGDPLTLETKSLANLTQALNDLSHVKTLRIHSRIPVVLPARIDSEFLSWAQDLQLNKVMVLHINHAQELSNKAIDAIAKLNEHDFLLLNQSVLLKGVNDSAHALRELSHALHKIGVLPYYLHQMDPVQNAAHFSVSETQAIAIHQQLKVTLPGYLVPKLVRETAGEQSKSTIQT
ncbi:MAG: EF-P beta-lysylation protein EpmB [Marinicella sp.]